MVFNQIFLLDTRPIKMPQQPDDVKFLLPTVIMKGFIALEIKENIYLTLDSSSENERIQDGLFYLPAKGKMNPVPILVIGFLLYFDHLGWRNSLCRLWNNYHNLQFSLWDSRPGASTP